MIYSQVWHSLTSGKSTYFVMESSDTLIWNYTARFDTLINGDSVYNLPAYYDICRGCTQYDPVCAGVTDNYITETDSFLIGDKMILTPGNDWVFSKRNLLLKNTNLLHQSWLADTTHNITAEVDTIVSLSVLGIMDSVRVYRFSTGDSVLIGQHFGLISFPSWYNSGKYLRLAGSREDQLGDYLPSHYTLNDWQPGDVFYYEGWGYSCINQNPCPCGRTKTRYDILSRIETMDSITYQIQKTRFLGNSPNCYYTYMNSGATQQTTYTQTTAKRSHLGDVWLDTFSLNVNDYLNPAFLLSYHPYPHIARCTGFDYAGLKGITFNNHWAYYPGQFTFMGNTYPLQDALLFGGCSDSLFRQSISHGYQMSSYLEGIGIIKEQSAMPDNATEEELKGFTKNGITEGTVTSVETLLLLSAESHTLTDVNIYYSDGAIYVDGLPADAFPVQFTISDMSGKTLYHQNMNTSGQVFNLNRLPAGLYIIDAHSGKHMIPVTKIRAGME